MHSPEEGPETDGLPQDNGPEVRPDWEAFYSDYRKPGFVDGFEITTKLGGGMFGMVFRARRMSIGKDYAIKFLKVDDGEVRRAVLSELEQVKYFAQIDHPNLVSIEDRGEVHGIPFLVMAFAGTETLRDKMNACGIGEGEVPTGAAKDELLRAFLQSCRGLQALHERSLVHFDIKPANVFLKGGVARLGDYGLSKLVTHSRGSLSMGRGTPYYMAPEMLKRRGDARSDIYSLGVMLYEILCGKVPFTGDSEWEVLRKHESSPPELPPHLTPVERTVLTRCMAKDAGARFQSVAELLRTFGSLSSLDGMPPAVTGMPPAVTTAPMHRAQAASLPQATKGQVVPPPLPGQRGRTDDVGPVRSNPPPLGKVASPIAAAATPAATHSMPEATSEAATRRRMRRRARHAGPGFGARFGVLFAICVMATGFLMWMSASRVGPSVRSMAVEAPRPPMPASSPRTIQQAVNQQAQLALANGRRAAQRNRPADLRKLNLDVVEVPDDFAAYSELLDPLEKSSHFVPALATRLEYLGRPALVAAVARLQEYDYQSGLDCRAAANLQRLLAQMTGVKLLVLDCSGPNPSPRETCMFRAVADGWRIITERYAANDRLYEELLVRNRPAGVTVEGTSPR